MITLFVILVLFTIGILIPKNEGLSIFGWIYLIWLSISAPGKYLLGDYVVYQSSYSNFGFQNSQFEKGYTFLEYLGNMAGLNFESFRECFVTIGIIIFYLGVRRFTKNHALVLAMYIPTLWVVDIIQMRSFVMMSLMIFGFSLLLNNNFVGKFASIVIFLIGASIHSSGYLFLIGLLMFFFINSISNFIKYLVCGEVIGIILLPVLFRSGIFISLISFLGNITGRSTLVNNLSNLFATGTPTTLKLIYYLILIFCLIIIMLIIKDEPVIIDKKQVFILLKVILAGVTVLFVGTVLLDIASDYSRLIRHGIIYIYVLLGWYFQNIKRNGQITVRHMVIGSITIVLLFSVYITSQTTWGSDVPMSTPHLLHIIVD